MLTRRLLESPKGWGHWLPGEPALWLEGCNFRPYPMNCREGERGWRLSSSTNGQLFSQSCSHNKASIKTPMEGVQRAPRLATTGRRWEGGVLGKGMEAPTLSPISRPRHLFHLASPEFKYLVSLIPYSLQIAPLHPTDRSCLIHRRSFLSLWPQWIFFDGHMTQGEFSLSLLSIKRDIKNNL